MALSRGTDKISLDTVTEIIENLPDIGAKDKMPTIAETLDRQGYKRGFIAGKHVERRKGLLRTALSLWQKNCDIPFIMEVTGFEKDFLQTFIRTANKLRVVA
ncbi:MAG: hypothetical protein AAF518_11515 [Spirochaetota bacterium]